MARIWYSVQGEGLGHAIRSAVIIKHLLPKHQLLITGCNQSFPFLREKFGSAVRKIEGYSFVFENNGINISQSLRRLLSAWPSLTGRNATRVLSLVKSFQPDLVISDFEPASHYATLFFNLPIISLDNIGILSECEKIPITSKYKILYNVTRQAIKLFNPFSDYYLIPSIVSLKPRRKNVFLFPPVLRPEILASQAVAGRHILVYQSTATNQALFPALKNISAHFLVYGLDQERREGNLVLRKFSEANFIEDLRCARAVIVSGGFTAISEALYYHKPILAWPIKNHFEQIFNGLALRQLGYGDWAENLDQETIRTFLAKIPIFEKKLANLPLWDNSELLTKLDFLIDKIASDGKKRFRPAKIFSAVEKIKQEAKRIIIKTF